MSGDHTRGKSFIVTQVEDIGEYSRRIHYLFPDGTRRGVVISMANDSDETRRRIGEAWTQGRTNLTKRGRSE